MAFKWYHGKTGVVWNVTKRAVGVEVNKTVRCDLFYFGVGVRGGVAVVVCRDWDSESRGQRGVDRAQEFGSAVAAVVAVLPAGSSSFGRLAAASVQRHGRECNVLQRSAAMGCVIIRCLTSSSQPQQRPQVL